MGFNKSHINKDFHSWHKKNIQIDKIFTVVDIVIAHFIFINQLTSERDKGAKKLKTRNLKSQVIKKTEASMCLRFSQRIRKNQTIDEDDDRTGVN